MANTTSDKATATDFQTAAKHLAAIDPSGIFTFVTLTDDKEARAAPGFIDPFAKDTYTGTLEQYGGTLQRLADQGAGIFFAVNEMDGKGRAKKHVKRIRFIPLDIDDIPYEQALELLDTFVFEPNFISRSKRGLHAGFVVEDCTYDDYTRLTEALAFKYQGDGTLKNFGCVLRLAGTVHQKDPANLVRVELIRDDPDRSNTAADIAQALGGWPEVDRLCKLAEEDRKNRRAGAPATAGKVADPEPADGDAKVRDGGRTRFLTSAAGTLRNTGLKGDGLRDALRALNRSKCDPPKDEAWVDELAASYSKKDARSPRATKDAAKREDLRELLERVSARIAHKLEGKAFNRDHATAKELSGLTFVHRDHTVQDTLPVGYSILSARPKMGKGFVALQIAESVAMGAQFLNRATYRGDVLYIGNEDTLERIHKRLAMRRDSGDNIAGLHLHTHWPNVADGGLNQIVDWLEEHPEARLVIVDVLGKFVPQRGRGEDDYLFVSKVLMTVQQIAFAYNVSILCIHHENKAANASGDFVDNVMGSSAYSSNADAVWSLARKRGEDEATFHITSRDFEGRSEPITFDPARGVWLPFVRGDETKLKGNSSLVFDAIKAGQRKQKEIQDWAGLGQPRVSEALKELLAKRLILRHGSPQGFYYELRSEFQLGPAEEVAGG